MMRSKRLLLMLMVSIPFACLSPSAFAAMMSIPYGWYAELNGGVMKISNANFPGSAKSLNGVGANVSLGYKFMPFFAVELGDSVYSDTTIQDQVGTTAAAISHTAIDLAAKGIVPIVDSGFEFFTKIGASWLYSHLTISNPTAANNIGVTSSTRKTAGGLFVGIGGQYYFTPEVAVNLQWTRVHGNSSSGIIDLYSVGISIIFA